MCVSVWHSSLTKRQSTLIERIQKVSFRIILDNQYRTYENALKLFKTETLENRRTSLCHRFAMKNMESEHSFFERTDKQIQTRSKMKVKEFASNTQRFAKSSLPYLARLINSSWVDLSRCLYPVDYGYCAYLAVRMAVAFIAIYVLYLTTCKLSANK